MKATEFEVVKEAHRAARGHLVFFNRMMAAKVASSGERRSTGVPQSGKTRSLVRSKTTEEIVS